MITRLVNGANPILDVRRRWLRPMPTAVRRFRHFIRPTLRSIEWLVLFALPLGWSSGKVSAQGAGRLSIAGEQAAARSRITRPENYNFQVGDASFQAEASMTTRFDWKCPPLLMDPSLVDARISRMNMVLSGHCPVFMNAR